MLDSFHPLLRWNGMPDLPPHGARALGVHEGIFAFEGL